MALIQTQKINASVPNEKMSYCVVQIVLCKRSLIPPVAERAYVDALNRRLLKAQQHWFNWTRLTVGVLWRRSR